MNKKSIREKGSKSEYVDNLCDAIKEEMGKDNISSGYIVEKAEKIKQFIQQEAKADKRN